MKIVVEKEAVTLFATSNDGYEEEVSVTITRKDWVTFYGVAKAAFGAPKNATTGADDGFDAFWAIYPRKTAKADALSAWRASPASGHLATILSCIERSLDEWTDPKYIPHASTWIRQRRWEDESGHTDKTLGVI